MSAYRLTLRLPAGDADREHLRDEAARRGLTAHAATLLALQAAGLLLPPDRPRRRVPAGSTR